MNPLVTYLPGTGSHAWLRHIELHTGRPIGHGLGYPLPPPAQAIGVRLEQHLGFDCEPRVRWEEGYGSQIPRLYWHDYGLFAPSGPLPEHITETLLHAPKHEAMLRFVGDLTQRLAQLHYRAWAQRRPECDHSGASDSLRVFAGLLSSPNVDALPHLAWHKPGIGQLAQLAMRELGIRLQVACSPLRRVANDQACRLGLSALGSASPIGVSIAIFGIGRVLIAVEAPDIRRYRNLRDSRGTERVQLNRLIALCIPAGSDIDIRIQAPVQAPLARLGTGRLGSIRACGQSTIEGMTS